MSHEPHPPTRPGSQLDHLADLYRQMLLIRRCEEEAARAYAQGKIGGFLHLYIGQEAVAVGSIAALRPEDYDNIDDDRTEEIGNDLATAEYRSIEAYPAHSARPTLPSEPPPTVRRPPSPSARGVLPRRSDPKIRAAASAARAWEPSQTPPDYGSDVQVTRRRRGG